MNAALELGSSVGKAAACRALGVPRASLYRRMLPAAPPRARPTPARALEAAAKAGRVRRSHAQEARPQSGCQSSGQAEPRAAGRYCPPDQEAEERRADNRGPKKVAALLGNPIPNIQIDEES